MKRNTFGKFLSILLAVVMLASMLPATLLTASAEDAVATASEVFGYANAGNEGSNISLLYKDDTYGGLHTITAAGALRIRVNADKGDNADGKSWTATKIKFNNEDLTRGWYKLTMKTTTIYDHGASTKGFKLYIAEYDENKTTGEEYMASDDTFFVYTAPSNHALVRNASASTVTHDLGSVAITDMSKEYVLIIELQGKEYHIEDFTFTRTADFSTVESFAFKNSTSSAKDILTKYNEYSNDNPNWTFFGRDAAWAGTFSGISTAGQLRARVEATPGAAWMAFKVKFADARIFEPGQFELSMNLNQLWPYGASTRSTAFYLGEYDETKTSGADYMTAENLVSAKSYVNTGSAVTYKIGKKYIYDTTKEYILVVKLQGEELYLTGFNLERVGDLPKQVTGVSLDKKTAELYVGDKTTLTATVEPEDAEVSKAVTWSSSADGIATVDQNGVVTAVAPGNATITATTVSGSFTDTCEVTVNAPDFEFIDFKASSGNKTITTAFPTYGTDNPNWYVLDADSGNWGSTMCNFVSGETLRFRVEADKGENNDGTAWIAFKFKFSNKEYLEAGSYSLVMNTTQSYTHGSSNRYADFFFAKYDADKTTGEDYMDAANVVAAKYYPAQGGTPRAHTIGNVVVDDMDAEYVLVMKNSGLDPHIDSFKLTRVGDAPTSEVFSFAGANAHLHGGNWAEYGINNKNWKAYDLSDDYKNASSSDRVWAGSQAGTFFRFSDLIAVPDAWSALKIRFTNPMEPGEYKLKYTVSNIYPGRDTADLRKLGFYLAPIVDGKVAKDYIADYNAIKPLATTSKPGASDVDATLETDTFYLTDTSKEFAFVIELDGCEIYLKSFELERVGDLPTDAVVELDYSRFGLQIGQTASPRVRYKNDSKKLIAAVAPFTAADPNVISVSANGTVKGINPGRSAVSTKIDGVTFTTSSSFQVSDGASVSGDANIYAYSLVDGVAGAAGVASTAGAAGTVASVAIGTNVTLTADEEVEGAKFSHWASNSGTFLSDELEYSFKAYTNSAIIAVYESEEIAEGDVAVSFYTDFGSLIDTVTRAAGDVFADFAAAVANDSYRGYTITGWTGLNGDFANDTAITKNTAAVAKHDAFNTFSISINGQAKSYAYNAPVEATSDAADFSYWTRDGKIVSYNKAYTTYAWNDTALAAVCEGAVTARVAVVLAKDGNDYMVEYDLPTGYTFVEAGIVGFASGTPTVASYGVKASTSKKDHGLHGQFTASCDETVVRGYVMYKDASNNLLVKYAD